MAMIQPGLERISLLLKDLQFPWKAIHVAGTNGKGSICHYAATLLRRRTIRVGHFTSPHLVDRWDCISINETPVEEAVFRKMEEHYTELSIKENINASPFEILTATAFTLFNRAKIEIGVIEVGMGGMLDATNILNNQAVSVISKIAKDHEAFLGNTLAEIAKHKAGILRPNVPYIVNPMNEWNVHDIIDEYAREIGAGPRLTGDTPELRDDLYSLADWRKFADQLRPFQRDNAVLAIVAVKEATKSIHKPMKDSLIADELNKKRAAKPGRFQFTKVQPVFGRPGDPGRSILVDGAHNPDAALALDDFMSQERKRPRHNRQRPTTERQKPQTPPPKGGWPVTWVLAMTDGKDASQYLSTILKPGDNVITTSFGPVDGMPWVKSMNPEVLLQTAQSVCEGITGLAMPLQGCLRALCAAKYLTTSEYPIVVTGSLYLIGDLHRELRGRNKPDYWTDMSNEEEKIAYKKIHKQEQYRINRLLSGQATSATPGADEESDVETSAQRKERLRAEIEALDKEMDLLAIEELQLLNSNRSSTENFVQDEATEDPLTTSSQPNEKKPANKDDHRDLSLEPRRSSDPEPTLIAIAEPRPFSKKFQELGDRKKDLEQQVKEQPASGEEQDSPSGSMRSSRRTPSPNRSPRGVDRIHRRPSFLLARKAEEM